MTQTQTPTLPHFDETAWRTHFGPLVANTPLPRLTRVRQCWPAHALNDDDVAATVRAQLETVGVRQRIVPGMRVAVTAGSRGIRNIVPILHTSIAWLRDAGAEPFVVPAMGSHGGATAAGQVQVLNSLGITEETMGCPILATMDVVTAGHLDDSDHTPVSLDRRAAEADGILVVNRVKPHTSFTAAIESGLAKMIAVGLGNRAGAETVHRDGVVGLRNRIVPMAQQVVARGTVLAGLAILEDAYEQTADIVAVPPGEIGGAGETALLERSRTLLARLPFDALDVLVVEEMGKDKSGTGMDTNVIGRLRIPGEPEPASPRIRIVVALDLSDASHGNAAGMGLADIITAQLASKVNLVATYTSHLTAGLIGVQRAALPITLPTEHDAIAMAIRVCGQPDPAAVRLVRIRNTLLLDELLVSDALLPEVAALPHLEVISERERESKQEAERDPETRG